MIVKQIVTILRRADKSLQYQIAGDERKTTDIAGDEQKTTDIKCFKCQHIIVTITNRQT